MRTESQMEKRLMVKESFAMWSEDGKVSICVLVLVADCVFRTVRNWRPMRFGGGLGCRIAQNSKKEQQPQQEVVVEVQPTQSNSNYDSRDRSREERLVDALKIIYSSC